jgi:elongation factor 1-alpha
MAVRDSVRKKAFEKEGKPHINLVFIGHVDHGKSTLVGRLLLETGSIDPHLIDKYKEEATKKGKSTFELAWVMDALKEERERGLTIDIAYMRLDTDKYYITIIDAPGHQDFIKNMITGASQADAAVLVVAAPEGVMAQTKEHASLAKVMGVEQLIVAINKMDATEPRYDEQRYNSVREDVGEVLRSISYNIDSVRFVPISAFTGDNVTKPSNNIPWYRGITILDALNNLYEPIKPTGLPLRIPIEQVYSITGVGTVPIGRVETGVLNPGDRVIFQPSGKIGEVKSIEMHKEPLPKAEPGDNIGFNVRGVSKNDIKRGEVAGHVEDPPTVVETFTAQIVILQHPRTITVGYTPVFHCHTTTIACTFEELINKLDPRSGEVIEGKPVFLKTGDVGTVRVRPTRPMVIERIEKTPHLGRFAIRDLGKTVAVGVCIDIEEKRQ